MSAQRRDRNKNSGSTSSNRTSQQNGRNRSSQGDRRNRSRRRHARQDRTSFWGDPSKLPSVPEVLRVTAQPAAVPRSLGPPPLPGHETIAGHYYDAVYDRAVATAGALAAAGGLIAPEALAEELGHQ